MIRTFESGQKEFADWAKTKEEFIEWATGKEIFKEGRPDIPCRFVEWVDLHPNCDVFLSNLGTYHFMSGTWSTVSFSS